MFLLIEAKHPDIEYEIIRTGLYFEQIRHNIVMHNIDNRLYAMEDSEFFERTNKPRTDEIKHFPNTQLLNPKWTVSKSAHFDKICVNHELDNGTFSAQSWKDVPDWRKIKTIGKTPTESRCYDLLFLIKAMTADLNVMSNDYQPAPMRPRNPLTSVEFSAEDCENIKGLINDNYIEVAPPLRLFLDRKSLYNEDVYKTVYAKNWKDWKQYCQNVFQQNSLKYLLAKTTGTRGIDIQGYWRSNIEIAANPNILQDDANIKKLLSYYNDPVHDYFFKCIDKSPNLQKPGTNCIPTAKDLE